MALTFDFFADSQLAEALAELLSVHQVGGSPPIDHRIFFGSPDSARQVQADSQPGVDPILVSIADADPGAGHEPTAVKLALTQAGLDTATAGAALDIGTQVLGGAANAVEIWVRVVDETGQVSDSTELQLQTPVLQETVA